MEMALGAPSFRLYFGLWVSNDLNDHCLVVTVVVKMMMVMIIVTKVVVVVAYLMTYGCMAV